MSELLTAEELAERLKVSPHTIRLWNRAEKIPAVWLSATVRRFDFDEVLSALRQRDSSPKGKGVSRAD
jgi:excisionase family DNA binding protein